MKRKRDSPDADAETMSPRVNDGNSSSEVEFEVFLSFRGPDTRLTFTDCLYHSLDGVGIRVFRDDEAIRKGKKIRGELLCAIKSSKIYLPIFSRDYASSKWCLRELTRMLKCSKKANDKEILPIFYDVNPEDVKLETPLYLDALNTHEENCGFNKVQRWKEALTEVGKIGGWEVKKHGWGQIIKTIIEVISTKLMIRIRNLPDHFIGIHDHVKAITDKLNEASCDVLYLVIFGMGGIGKTTLASFVFNQISNQFHGYSFLSDIRETAKQDRIVDLQNQLLSNILSGKSPKIYNSNDGINTIRQRFRDKKVLIVLDDVDDRNQLSMLAGKSDWFGQGSRVIITTRDISRLPIKEKDKMFKIYKMTEMDSFHAFKLFSKCAFKMDFPPDDFVDISRQFTTKIGGLPLTLEVIGSSLYGNYNKRFWRDNLEKLDSFPNEEVLDRLQISYDMLRLDQREIFLDIACFFVGKETIHPCYMWKAFGYDPWSEIHILIQKSLIKITKDRTLWMHDQLRHLGRKIVKRERVPGKRSRLWEPKVAFDVVRKNQGTENVVALKLTGYSKEQTFTREQFSKLPNLKYLELEGGNFVGDFKNLLTELTWFTWIDCPSDLNARNLCLEQLAVLLLRNSDVTENWAGWKSCLVSENLKVIESDSGPSLERTPDFSKCPNLERLIIESCTNSLAVHGSLSKLEHLKYLRISSWDAITIDDLIEGDYGDLFPVPSVLGSLKSLSMLHIRGMQVPELHHSIGEMTGLKDLFLHTCYLPTKLPNSIGDLRTLERMTFTNCSIWKLPKTIGRLESLLELDLGETMIRKLPASIGNLKKLRKMSMSQASIKKLPKEIGGLESLLVLNLSHTNITELPTSIGDLKQLEFLYVSSTKIRELPKAIWMLKNLKVLCAGFCENMEGEIPSEIEGLSFLRKLELTKSKIRRLPTTMNKLAHLQQLCLDQCDTLEQLPELPVSLKELKFSPHLLWIAHNLSCLTNLVNLYIRDNTPRLSELRRGAPKIKWIKRLSYLESLTLVIKNVTFHRINLATLSRLRILNITCVNTQSLTGLPSSLEALTLHDVKSPMRSSLFSSLTNLSRLSLPYCQLREVEFDDVLGEQLKKLRCLDITVNILLQRLIISRFEGLQELRMISCGGLMEIQGVEKLESLEELTIVESSSFLRLPDLSKLKKLRRLNLMDFPQENLLDLHIPNKCEVIFPDFSGTYEKWKVTCRNGGGDTFNQL